MPLDVSGALLEGVRISEGNNPYSFPPRDLVSNWSAFSAVSSRAEYVLVSASSDPSRSAMEIADPDLRFRWTRNDHSVLRFSYDSFSKRWLPAPGGPPAVLGPLSNEERLFMPVPDPGVAASAPFSVYVGAAARSVTFTVVLVGDSADFSPPSSLPSGTVQVSSVDGSMNFSAPDVADLGGQDVLSQRQSFFDRTSVKGSFGVLPASSSVDYYLFLNPRPASGQSPVVRIGYGPHMPGTQYATEGDLPPSPAAGTFAWSLDTGRVIFSPADVNAYAGETVYYDGVYLGVVSVPRTAVASPVAFPSSAFTVPLGAVGAIDQRFVVFAEKAGRPRTYWTVVVVASAPSGPPPDGTVYLRSDTGQSYLSADDVDDLDGWSLFYLDSVLLVEDGVSVQVYRSGVNGSGEAQVPDFTVVYEVEDQVLVDGITASPFVMLPTVPIVDDSLSLRVEQGPSSSGTFTGDLVDGTDPGDPGLGYLLNLDVRQMKYCRRRTSTVSLGAPTPVLKLADAAISSRGLVVTRDGEAIIPGVDFGFDPDTGVVTFTEPYGQSDPEDQSGLSGTAGGSFLLPESSLGDVAGKWIFVQSGPNVGIRRVLSVDDLGRVAVSPAFAVAGSVTFDVRSVADVVADRFWKVLDPPYKKFSLAYSDDGTGGPYHQLHRPAYSVLPSVSQVNLAEPAEPGRAFLATYVGLVTTDDGASYSPVNRTELATFKVRQEAATSSAGSSIVSFNPGGLPVSASSPISVYVNGVPVPDGYFEFEAPGTLRLADPVKDGQAVVLDYFVEVALGGETSFNLSVQPMDLDSLQIAQGSDEVVMNGDQRPYVAGGSVLWIGRSEAVFVDAVEYDSSTDTTTVLLDVPVSAASAGAQVLSCLPPYEYLDETSPVGTIPKGSNSVPVSGDVTGSYGAGTVVSVSGYAFVVSASQYVEASGVTRVTFSAPASRSFIAPAVRRSSRPVFDPGRAFLTSRQADLASPFQLVRMGSSPSLLVPGSDYEVVAGGSVELKQDLVFGDSLYALYVAYSPQPAGTVLVFNYAHAVAPDSSNGLLGQRLVADYRLYAPDSFFYRVETVLTFLPEVQDLLRQGATSSGSSGPSTQSATGMSNKDFGRPSLYYDEQHQGNIDAVVVRLLKFYNDLVNMYEDVLANLDGRVVGGSSGRFRFDGVLNNPPRASYSEITNDIDDRVLLYSRKRLTGFFVYQNVPVYGSMAFPNALSRLFPTSVDRAVALSDETGSDDRGEAVGSLDLENILSVGTMVSARSNQFFTSVEGNVYSVDQNGQEDLLVPPFVAGQIVNLYAENGSPDAVGAEVVSVSGTGPYEVELDTATPLRRGSILRDVSAVPVTPTADSNHFYQNGRDLSVDPENGQVLNVTVGPPFFPDAGASQARVWGDEVVQARVNYNNADLEPRRIPALDGLTLDDSGIVPAPRLRRTSESDLLSDEVASLSGVGVASSFLGLAVVSALTTDVTGSTLPVQVGDVVVFTAGPNAGAQRIVDSVLAPDHFTVFPGFPFASPGSQVIASLSLFSSSISVSTGQTVSFLSGPNAGFSGTVSASTSASFRFVSSFTTVDPGSNFETAAGGLVTSDVVLLELGILSANVAAPAVPPSLLPSVASELSSLLAIISYSGPVLASGTGTASGSVLSDPSASFILDDVVAGCLVFIPSGSNFGLYRVGEVTSTSLTVESVLPYVPFPSSGSTSYQVIKPESFLNPSQWGTVSQVLRETRSFYLSTAAWYAAISPAGAAARLISISVRTDQIETSISGLEKVLSDQKLYDVRYLWIDQRVNRQDGNLAQQAQAAARRAKNLRKMLADQQKLLVAESI